MGHHIPLNPNGSRDTSFAFTAETGLYIGNGIALQTDGKLVFFGYENGGGNYRFAILRLNPNGVPDTGFGANGRVLTQIGSFGGAADGAVQPDGKIIALGGTGAFFDTDIAIVRYLGDSTPTSPCGNPIDCAEFFVRQQYLDFLGREPEPAGFNGWLNILNNCGVTVPQPCDRIEVSSAFFRSPEFQGRGYFIYRFYPTIGKVPIYSDWVPDFARVSGFLTDQQLEAAKAAFVTDFMARPEFQSRYASTFSNPTAYVDALLQTVGLPNHPSRQSWINSLAGNNTTTTRAQVLRSLVESNEVYQKYYNEAFVVMQYFRLFATHCRHCISQLDSDHESKRRRLSDHDQWLYELDRVSTTVWPVKSEGLREARVKMRKRRPEVAQLLGVSFSPVYVGLKFLRADVRPGRTQKN